MITLIVKDDKLYIPNAALYDAETRKYFGQDDAILVCRYAAGDCDTIPWPLRGFEQQLFSALYDARECGELDPGTRSVQLPDGSAIDMQTGRIERGLPAGFGRPDIAKRCRF